MDAEIVTRPDARVLGITARINHMTADYRELWEKRFMPHHDAIAARTAEKGYYGVYYGTGQAGIVDFVAGMPVGDATDALEELILRDVPGGLYAMFRCTMATLATTWGEIYRAWLPASTYVEDETRPAIEYYPPDMKGPDSPLQIYVAVKPKS